MLTGDDKDALTKTLIFFLIGFLIGVGESLRQGRETFGQAIGGAIVLGGMTMAAGIFVIWIPQIPFLAQLGLSGFLGALGMSTIRKIVTRKLSRNYDD